MSARRGWILGATLCGGLLLSSVAPAEVSVEVDDFGHYKRTVVLGNASEKNVKIWSVVRAKDRMHPLNPNGDANGDRWPTILENPYRDGFPWAVWSRHNGVDYDLAWSRWDGTAWLPVQWVRENSTQGDSLDVDMAFDASDQGRPYIVWWEEDGGGFGQVFMSMMLNHRWMSPYQVSDADVDSRYPEVAFRDDGAVEVTFDTLDGLETRTLVIMFPDTITDDLVPLGVVDEIGSQPGGSEINP